MTDMGVVSKDVVSWDALNDALIKSCTENETEQFQKMNLLTFVQLLALQKVPEGSWSMFSNKPDIVVFNFSRKEPDLHIFFNISFLLNGTTVLTVSEFVKRRWGELLFRIFLFPKYKTNFFFIDYAPTEINYDIMQKFMDIPKLAMDNYKAKKPLALSKVVSAYFNRSVRNVK